MSDLWIAISLTVRVRPARTCLSPEEAGGPVAQHPVFRQGDHQVFCEGGGRVACPIDGTIWEVRQILAPDSCCRVVKTAYDATAQTAIHQRTEDREWYWFKARVEIRADLLPGWYGLEYAQAHLFARFLIKTLLKNRECAAA